MFNVLLKLLLEHLHLLEVLEVLVHLVLHLVLHLALLLLVHHLHLLHDVSLLSFLGARDHLRHVLVEQLGVHVAHIPHVSHVVPHVPHVVTHRVHETRVFSIGWRCCYLFGGLFPLLFTIFQRLVRHSHLHIFTGIVAGWGHIAFYQSVIAIMSHPTSLSPTLNCLLFGLLDHFLSQILFHDLSRLNTFWPRPCRNSLGCVTLDEG